VSGGSIATPGPQLEPAAIPLSRCHSGAVQSDVMITCVQCTV
jgi:hypothetical protein